MSTSSSSSIRRIASSRPSRQLQCLGDRTPGLLHTSGRRTSPRCSHPSIPHPSISASSSASYPRRALSTGSYIHHQSFDEGAPRDRRPRWASTPEGMTMPFRVRPRKMNNDWTCNEDPRRVDDFYASFLGPGGGALLSEDVRWQAITHKSFDQGKRGFNDKLSYLGKRILDLQTSLSLIALPQDPLTPTGRDQYGRHAYEHPLLTGLMNLTERKRSQVLLKPRLAQLGREYGLEAVLRWRPKEASNPLASGQELVMAQAVYAIVGAVALEKGKVVADRVAKERILRPLGIVREL